MELDEARQAARIVVGSLVQFAYGPIEPTTPYSGEVELTPEQFAALKAFSLPVAGEEQNR